MSGQAKGGQPVDVDITKVTPQQLAQLSKSIEQEIDVLTQSYSQLVSATNKFHDSKLVLNYLKERSHGKEIMVPLTSSLYVPGVMEDNNKVLVEAGAGYFIEETVNKAKDYCERKAKSLQENANKVGEII
jgi:prefoldin alpha subunit